MVTSLPIEQKIKTGQYLMMSSRDSNSLWLSVQKVALAVEQTQGGLRGLPEDGFGSASIRVGILPGKARGASLVSWVSFPSTATCTLAGLTSGILSYGSKNVLVWNFSKMST